MEGVQVASARRSASAGGRAGPGRVRHAARHARHRWGVGPLNLLPFLGLVQDVELIYPRLSSCLSRAFKIDVQVELDQVSTTAARSDASTSTTEIDDKGAAKRGLVLYLSSLTMDYGTGRDQGPTVRPYTSPSSGVQRRLTKPLVNTQSIMVGLKQYALRLVSADTDG